VAGLVYVASYVAVLIDAKDAIKLLNYQITIQHHTADLRSPIITGAAPLLGALLLVGVASVGRWRRWPAAVPATVPTTDESGTTEEPTKDFWTPTSPPGPSTLSTPPLPAAASTFSAFGDESTTERTVPNPAGSPWGTPPAGNATEQAR
jgi:hypothetical protein